MTNTVLFPGLGISFHISRVAFSIGDFAVYWYGVIIAAGLVLALTYAFHHAVEFGINDDRMTDVVVVGVVMGVICARIMYVLFAPFDYTSLYEMIDLRDGGLAIYGGIIGGFLFGGITCKVRKVPLLPMFDLISMGYLIGQGIGRWGNFFNQEAFGCNTTLPWGMISETTTSYLTSRQAYLASMGVTVDPSLPVHPTFLYESLWCLLSFVFLRLTFKKRRFNGDVFLTYIILYGTERFLVESLRTDSLEVVIPGLRISQLIAAVSVCIAIALKLYGYKKAKGITLMVPLAPDDYKKYSLVSAEQMRCETELPATASRSEFIENTKCFNEEIERLTSGGNKENSEPIAADAQEEKNI